MQIQHSQKVSRTRQRRKMAVVRTKLLHSEDRITSKYRSASSWWSTFLFMEAWKMPTRVSANAGHQAAQEDAKIQDERLSKI